MNHPARIPLQVAFLARAEHTLILAGSCGRELFNRLALPGEIQRQVTIFAYRPVALDYLGDPAVLARAADLVRRLSER